MLTFSVDVSLNDAGWVIVTADVPGRVVADTMANVDRVAREFIAGHLDLPADQVAVRIGVVRMTSDGTRSPAEILQARTARRGPAPLAGHSPGVEAPGSAIPPVLSSSAAQRHAPVRRERALSHLGVTVPLAIAARPVDERSA